MNLYGNLGEDNMAWSPAFQDYKVILEQLKSQDEMMVYEAVTNLQSQLSIAQENTLSNFAVDQYIPALVEILKRHPESDISNEINMFVIQCLTNLMDIFPNICNSIVTHGGVKSIAQVLERSMGFIDLNEACIKALEKISIENPYAILSSGAIGLALNMMDFFEITTQKRIIQILMNISRHSASENDLNESLLPIFPCLCMLLQQRSGSDASSKVESVSTIILRIFESIFRFISPNSQLDKLSQQFEKLGHTGIVDAILQSLQDYCVFDNTIKASIVQNSQGQSSIQKIMTNQTIQNFLKILSLCGSYSIKLSQQILDFDVLRLIESFMPSQEDQKKLNFSGENFPFIMETLALIDSLLPQREEEEEPGQSNEHIKAKIRFEKDKKSLFVNSKQQNQIFFAAEKLLPKIFNVYENNIQSQIRTKTLQLIDKLILLFNEELLNNFIEPYSFAKFIYSNLRTNQISPILLCLQMVDKLMKSNPQTYTLPLIREGVSQFIKTITTLEQLEKTTGLSFKEVDTLEKHEEMLTHAKNALLKGTGGVAGSDQESRLIFEQTIQKYMELAKQHSSPGGALVGQRNQIKDGKTIVSLAQNLQNDFFDNQEFLNQINEKCGNELKTIKKLKALAEEIIELGKQQEFDFLKNKELMKGLSEELTQQRSLMSFELKESGLLEALMMYLTLSPKQIELALERKKAQASGEEVKHSEEIQMSSMVKNAMNVNKKQARCYLQRLKVFLHIILNKQNEKQPLVELVNLCHDLISQSDFLIFENQLTSPDQQFSLGQQISHPYSSILSTSANDPNQSMQALRQLTRRMRVNLVYDPHRSQARKISRDNQAMSGIGQDLLSQPLESIMPPPQMLQKSISHQPAFAHLADQHMSGPGQGNQELSKVFIKRNFLYSELKQVLVSVEQCASLFLLEDFLRNRIKTLDDVNTLKIPPSYYSSLKQPSHRSSQQARDILERAIERMREIMESGGGRETMKAETEDFQNEFIEELLSSKELSEVDQIDIIRQLEVHSLQMMDDYFAEHGVDNYEEGNEEIRGAFGDDIDAEERIYEFQRIIHRLRDTFKRRKLEIIKQQPSQKASSQKKESDENNGDAVMKEEVVQKEEVSPQQEEEKKQSSSPKEDVDMTDEEEEERRQLELIMNRKRQMRGDSDGAVMLGNPESQNQQEVVNEDLEQLIKESGDDIEYEFYINGDFITPNQTLFEIFRIQDNKARKQRESNPSALGGYLQQLYGRDSEQVTVHFAIKDKQDSPQKSRKDSMFDFAMKRDRTKSEVVEDFSISSINQFAQQLIEKEFTVINQFEIDDKDKYHQEKQVLQSSLKILKVLNYLCKNTNLFSSQGIKFLINTNLYDEEELKESGFQDLDLQVGLSQIHANLFHHHKLDSYILKNIQDPYNLISGAVSDMLTSIFKTCPFLFPFNTRLLFFKLISFIGSIDMNRSIFFLRQYLKQKLGKLPPEDKSSVKIQRQKVIVDRTKILECSLNLVTKISSRAFLEVEYKDEQGTGLGPTLEFYTLVAQEIKDFKIQIKPLWRPNMSDNTLFPAPLNLQKIGNEELQKIFEIFRLAGMMIAKSISDDRLIDLPISPLFWDLVLGKKMNIFDIERLDPNIFKAFAELQILANKKRDLDKSLFTDPEQRARQINTLKTASGARVEDLALTFVLPGFDDIELKLDGSATDVTIHNLQEYIDLTMHYIFHETVKIQIQAFKKGFNQIFPVENLRTFSYSSIELEDIVCGTQRNEEEWSNAQKLSEFVIPAHGYHMKSVQYLNLLKFMTELDKQERRKFLTFVTGSPRLPNGGFGALDPKLTVVLKKPMVSQSSAQLQMSQDIVNTNKSVDEILPSVMTCQNYVKLPAYSSYEILKLKFQQAYTEGSNNFTLS